MLVPDEALTDIRCNACKKYLSYFPIYIDQNSKSPICGRCSEHLTVGENYIRDVGYELLAQYIKFPCIYKSEGCIENLKPADIPNHEKDCPHRIIPCALDCIWQGTVHELLTHVEEVHPSSLLREGEFEMDILNSYEVYGFLVHDDEVFAMKRKFDASEKVLRCSLFCYKLLDWVTKYYYEMTVFNGARSLRVKFPMKAADNFQEENVTEIGIDNVKKMLDDPSIIIGSVRIFTTDEQETVMTAKKPNPEVNMDLLAELECPVCFDYIIPPIYQCVTGHSICGDCKGKVAECPSCKGEIKNTQNFTLEKMAFLLTYPCKFSEYGCDFASKPGKIKQHQKYCLLGPHMCPLKDYENCPWNSSAKEIYSHIVNTHHDNLLEIDQLFVFLNNGYFDTEDNQCYVKRFSDAMFKIHYRYLQDCFYWAVQLIGPPEQAKNYKFEIDIIDNGNNNQKIFLRNFCASLKDKRDTFAEPDQYVFLKVDQVRPLMSDHLSYTIRITK